MAHIYLCDVSMTDWPSDLYLLITSQSSLLASGSIPDDGSSRKRIGGLPIRAMAVLNFRLFPPLKYESHIANVRQML